MKELLISFFICLLVGAAINGNSEQPKPSGTTSEPDAVVKEIPALEQSNGETTTGSGSQTSAVETTDDKFDKDVLASQVPVLVDFSAKWCGPCQRMVPVVDQLAKEYAGRIKVVKVDVDSSPTLSSRYNIRSLPTFMVFKNGDGVDAHTGALPRETLAALINRNLP